MSPDASEKDHSFAARYGATILRGGIAAIPTALFRFQGTLGLSAGQVWFIAAILAHKWDAELPHPSLARLSDQTGIQRRQLHRYQQELVEAGWLRVINRRTQEGGKDTNLFDFSTLFAALEACLIGESSDTPYETLRPIPMRRERPSPRDATSHLKESVDKNQTEETDFEISKGTPLGNSLRAHEAPGAPERDGHRMSLEERAAWEARMDAQDSYLRSLRPKPSR